MEAGAYTNLVAEETRRAAALTARDEAFFLSLLYGTVERLLTLRSVLDKYSSVPSSKMKPELRAILLTGAYQILFTGVPAYGAVDEAVKLVRAGRTPGLSGFANAVLRRVAAEKSGILAGLARSGDLSYKYSCHPGLVSALLRDLGREEAESFLSGTLELAPVYIRRNPLAGDFAEPGKFEPTDLPGCFILSEPGGFTGREDYAAGRFHVEDISSQRAVRALGVSPGERALDVCAAPGGKTCSLAEDAGDRGEVVACDINPSRLRLVEENAARLRLTSIRTCAADWREDHPELGLFDAVLCDVPCSGVGAARRKPEIKLKDPAGFAGLPETQYAILSNAARRVRPGGRLLYSTCTLLSAENDGVTERFLADNPGFRPVERRLTAGGGADGFYYRLMEAPL